MSSRTINELDREITGFNANQLLVLANELYDTALYVMGRHDRLLLAIQSVEIPVANEPRRSPRLRNKKATL
jgi:hypothetical protein